MRQTSIHAPSGRLTGIVSAATVAMLVALVTIYFGNAGNHGQPLGELASRLNLAAPLRAIAGAHPDSIVGWKDRPATPARTVFEAQLDSLAISLDAIGSSLEHESPHRTRAAFRQSRLAYKRAEFLLETYSPTIAHDLNGPLEKGDGDAPPAPLGAPAAYQQLLSALPSDTDRASRDASRTIAVAMRDEVRHLRKSTRYLDVAELPTLESARTEIARVTTLGLAGVDLDDPRDAVAEAAASLDGMRAVVRAEIASTSLARSDSGSVSRVEWSRIDSTLLRATDYLRAHPDFDTLDRLRFIADFAAPAARAVATARAPLLARSYAQRRVWRANSATVFDRDALDATAFAPDFAPSSSPALIALGARLFVDPRLSGAGDRSCATCHQPHRAFTDGRAKPLLIRVSIAQPGNAPSRNTPTLLDVAYQPLYFADERAITLEDQIGAVLSSPTEMGSSATLAASRIAGDRAYAHEFKRTLAGHTDTLVTGRSVRLALAAYLRSLDSFDSRFDRAARGDPTAITAQERRGFTLFMGKARCATCHFAPLFSGVLPPSFTSSEPEIVGVATRPVTRHATLDPDSGRAGVDHIAEHRFAFKVPTLRNIAVTAPYMHNGAYATLDQVMRFYEHGGGEGIGAHVANQTLSSAPLHLTAAERAAVIAFLGTLTDTTIVVQPRALAER